MTTGMVRLILASIGAVAIGTEAFAGLNPNFTLPLHAEVKGEPTCEVWPLNCRDVMPTVNIPPGSAVSVFLMTFDACDLFGVQTAFEWPQDWQLIGSSWNCQSNQLTAVTPHDPGGPTEGTIATVFDCVQCRGLSSWGALSS